MFSQQSIMKILSQLLFIFISISFSQEPINYETTLIKKGQLFYTKDTNKPYSGPVFSFFDDGKKKEEITYKNGKLNGLNTGWYENGQKSNKGTFQDGKLDGLYTDWYENGQKSSEKTYNDREVVELIGKWNEDGSVKE